MIERLPRFAGPTSHYLVDALSTSFTTALTSKIGIDSLVGSITTKPWSHKGAWTRILQAELKRLGFDVQILTKDSKWNDFDVIILDHGMEYNGVFNIYGGANDELAARIEQFLGYPGKIISYEVPMPDVGKFVLDRSKTCTDRFKALVEKIPVLTAMSRATLFADAVKFTGELIVGDSHALSAWSHGKEIRRYDGRTLFGALKRGLPSMIYGGPWTHLTVYFGNIDIRHHLCRQPDPVKATKELAYQYLQELEKSIELFQQLNVVELSPVEDESRPIPKTGYYEGAPFHGSRIQRQELVDIFNGTLREAIGLLLLSWNYLPRNTDGSLSFDAMERPQSVHLSPEFYRFNIETGQSWTPPIEKKPEPKQNQSQPKTQPDAVVFDALGLPQSPQPSKPNIVVKSNKIERNEVYDDLLEYHTKALLLERRARQEKDVPLPDDPLMCNVHIYDSVHRYCAGFSNLLEDLHFPHRVGKLRNDRKDRLPLPETLYLYLVHRVTGSGASFRPAPEGVSTVQGKVDAKAHGYYNTIIPKLWEFGRVEDMVAAVRAHNGPYLTSKGNIPPQFKAVVGGFDKPSREYLCHHAIELVDEVIFFTRNKRNIREVVDFMNLWNKRRNMVSFHFCYTAFVNDVAEYWPQLVDPFSHTYYGPNCERTMSLSFNGSVRPRTAAFDQVMEWLVADTGYKPYDLEDAPFCDIQRYWSEEVPQGYGHLNRDQTRNNSSLKRKWGESKYYAWVSENVHLRSSGLTSDTRTVELSAAVSDNNEISVVTPSPQ